MKCFVALVVAVALFGSIQARHMNFMQPMRWGGDDDNEMGTMGMGGMGGMFGMGGMGGMGGMKMGASAFSSAGKCAK